MSTPAPTSGLHHLELWTADLAAAEPAWHWLAAPRDAQSLVSGA